MCVRVGIRWASRRRSKVSDDSYAFSGANAVWGATEAVWGQLALFRWQLSVSAGRKGPLTGVRGGSTPPDPPGPRASDPGGQEGQIYRQGEIHLKVPAHRAGGGPEVPPVKRIFSRRPVSLLDGPNAVWGARLSHQLRSFLSA